MATLGSLGSVPHGGDCPAAAGGGGGGDGGGAPPVPEGKPGTPTPGAASWASRRCEIALVTRGDFFKSW